MSSEIKSDQEMILLLSKMNAEERLAAFIIIYQNVIPLVVSRERIPLNHDPVVISVTILV